MPSSSGSTMQHNDTYLLDFALAWAAYGGPENEAIFVRYGFSVLELNRRVHSILDRLDELQAGRTFTDHERAALRLAYPVTIVGVVDSDAPVELLANTRRRVAINRRIAQQRPQQVGQC